MRAPARIESMLNQLRELWEKSPDMRLGQLIVNAVQPREPCPDVFYIEDTALQHRLADLSSRISNQNEN